MRIMNIKCIFINCKLNKFERKLVLAHELVHTILYSSKDFELIIDHTKLIRRSKVEQEANEFASYLIFGDGEEFDKNHELEYAVYKNINSWIVEDILRMRE